MSMFFEEDGEQLVEPRVEDVRSEAGVLALLKRQHGALISDRERLARGELALSELRERQERMIAEAERVIREQRANEPLKTLEWSGDARQAIEAYREFDTAGAPTQGIVLKSISFDAARGMQPEAAAAAGALVRRLPGGRIIVEGRSGYLTDPRPKTAEQGRIQSAYANFAATVALARQLARSKRREVGSTWDLIAEHPSVRRAFFALDRVIRSASEPAGVALRAMFERVLSGATGSGGDWIATPYLQGGWIGPYDLTPRLADRMVQRDAPAPSFTAPTMPAGELIARVRGRVQVEQPTSLPAVSQSTGKRTVTMTTLILREQLDDEWLADFERVGLVDMEGLMNRLRRGLMRTKEAAILHGDTTASHQDALSTWNMGGLVTAGAYDGSDSPLRAWKGLRKLAKEDSTDNDTLGTFSGTVAMASLARLGTRAMSPDVAWVCNINLLHKKLMVADDFRLWSSVGDQAAARSGVMGQLLSRDVILSEFMTSDLNASGVYDNTTKTKTALIAADFGAFEMWNYLEDSYIDTASPEQGVVHLIASTRCKMEKATVSDNGHPVSMDYDL